MSRTLVYWVSTAIVSLMLAMSLSYLTGSEQVVAGFAKAGYPQYLRIVLGLAKPAAAIVLLLPGLALLKEWAYAGVTITWLMASISTWESGEGAVALLPLGLLGLMAVSYATRPAGRRLRGAAAAQRTSAAAYARIWRGRTTRDRADAYQAYWLAAGSGPLVARGATAVQMLRADHAAETEFVTISWWPSVEAMAPGGDPFKAHHLPQDATYLTALPDQVEILAVLDARGAVVNEH